MPNVGREKLKDKTCSCGECPGTETYGIASSRESKRLHDGVDLIQGQIYAFTYHRDYLDEKGNGT